MKGTSSPGYRLRVKVGFSFLDITACFCHILPMIKTFKDKELAKLLEGEQIKSLPTDIQKRTFAKLLMLDAADSINDLRTPPANHLEALSGDRKGQYSIRINSQYRICFKWQKDAAFEVEVVDYH